MDLYEEVIVIKPHLAGSSLKAVTITGYLRLKSNDLDPCKNDNFSLCHCENLETFHVQPFQENKNSSPPLTTEKVKRTHYFKITTEGVIHCFFLLFFFIRDKETIQNIHYAISFELCTQVVLMHRSSPFLQLKPSHRSRMFAF